jgi:hypothetical protein
MGSKRGSLPQMASRAGRRGVCKYQDTLGLMASGLLLPIPRAKDLSGSLVP